MACCCIFAFDSHDVSAHYSSSNNPSLSVTFGSSRDLISDKQKNGWSHQTTIWDYEKKENVFLFLCVRRIHRCVCFKWGRDGPPSKVKSIPRNRIVYWLGHVTRMSDNRILKEAHEWQAGEDFAGTRKIMANTVRVSNTDNYSYKTTWGS